MMKGRVLDTVLILIIAISGGFVGYRLMNRNNVSAPLLQQTTIAPAAIEAPAAYAPLARAHPHYGGGMFQALLNMRSFRPTQWAEVRKKAPLNEYIFDASDACKSPNARMLPGYPLLTSGVLKRFKQDSLEFLIEVTGQICVRKNSLTTIISMGENKDDPALSLLADVIVEDIVQLPTDQLPRIASALFEIPAAKVTELLEPAMRRSHGKMSILRVSKPQPSKHNRSVPIQGFPRYDVVASERLTAWLNANPGVTILDVRSSKERLQTPILYGGSMIAAPYSTSDKKWQFRWDRTWTDLDKDDFDISQVLKLADTAANARPVLVVGAASFDGRPVWTLLALFSVNMGNVAWFYDGAASFNSALANNW